MDLKMIPLFSLIGYFLILLIMIGGEKTRVHKYFRIYIIAMLFWSFGAFMMRTGLPPSALFWNRILCIGFITAPFLLYHFSLIYYEKAVKRRELIIMYSIAGILLVGSFSGLIVQSAEFVDGHFIYKLGPFSPLLAIFATGYALFGTYYIYKKGSRGRHGENKNWPVIIGAGIYIFTSFLNFFPSIGSYPIDLLGSFIFATLITYSIYEQEFLTSFSYVKDAIIYGLVTACLCLSYFILLMLLYSYLGINQVYFVIGLTGLIAGISLVYFRKMKKELAENERRFKLLADNAKDIIYRFSFTHKKEFDYISPSVETITGYSQEDFYNSQELRNIIVPSYISSFSGTRYFSSRSKEPEIMLVTRKDGQQIWVEGQHVPVLDREGKLIAIEGILRDISERKRVEREFLRLNQLHILGETAATIAHEIRNPITTVNGFLQLLKERNEFSSYDKWFDVMVGEIKRANSIITDYLSFSKINQEKQTPQDLNQIIRNLYPLIEGDATNLSKEIVLELEENLVLNLNENQIKQLILNLVRNGLEAMEKGQILRIKTFRAGDSIVLTIQDQGKGMPPEVLEKIGTPFFTTKDQGTGLGLAVCYKIAEKHNAIIEVDSGSEGSTFSLRFKN